MEVRADYLPFGRPDFSEEEIAAVTRVMRTGWVGMGPEVRAFEEELAAFVGAKHVVALSSCTAALHLTLYSAGVKPGDEVICPSLTWCSSANAALYLGAQVRFTDINPDTCCPDPADILAQVTDRTAAVVVVHFGGYAIDTQSLRGQLPSSIKIIEDGAHAFGSMYPTGETVGSRDNPTCFSFYANKNLSTAEGGAVATHDSDLAEHLKGLRQHGQPADAWKRFTDRSTFITAPLSELGFKANYTDLQAAIGRVQLRRFPILQQRRLEIAEYYVSRLERMSPRPTVQADVTSPAHARHLFVIQLPLEELTVTRDAFLRELRTRNIGATLHYTPLHQMPLYAQRCGAVELPQTNRVGARIMTLPISSSMTRQDAAYVCDHLEACLTQFAKHHQR